MSKQNIRRRRSENAFVLISIESPSSSLRIVTLSGMFFMLSWKLWHRQIPPAGAVCVGKGAEINTPAPKCKFKVVHFG